MSDDREWPVAPGECLFSGGHVLMPQGAPGPHYCVNCGWGYDRWLAHQSEAVAG